MNIPTGNTPPKTPLVSRSQTSSTPQNTSHTVPTTPPGSPERHRDHGVKGRLSDLMSSVKKHLHLGARSAGVEQTDFTSPGHGGGGAVAALVAAPLLQTDPYAHLHVTHHYMQQKDEDLQGHDLARYLMSEWTTVHALPLSGVIDLVLYAFGATTASPPSLQQAYEDYRTTMIKDYRIYPDFAATALKTKLLDVMKDKMPSDQRRRFERDEKNLLKQHPPNRSYSLFKQGMVDLLREARQQVRQIQASAPTTAEAELQRAYETTRLKRDQKIQTLFELVLKQLMRPNQRGWDPEFFEIELNALLVKAHNFGPWPQALQQPQAKQADLLQALHEGANREVAARNGSAQNAQDLHQAIDRVAQKWPNIPPSP